MQLLRDCGAKVEIILVSPKFLGKKVITAHKKCTFHRRQSRHESINQRSQYLIKVRARGEIKSGTDNQNLLQNVTKHPPKSSFSSKNLLNPDIVLTFAPTESATLPIEQRTRAELLYIVLCNTTNNRLITQRRSISGRLG